MRNLREENPATLTQGHPKAKVIDGNMFYKIISIVRCCDRTQQLSGRLWKLLNLFANNK